MYRILHADVWYPLCSFELEQRGTGRHIFADYWDDAYYEIAEMVGTDMVGKTIDRIPAGMTIRTRKEALDRAQHPIEGSMWLYPWLRKPGVNRLTHRKTKNKTQKTE